MRRRMKGALQNSRCGPGVGLARSLPGLHRAFCTARRKARLRGPGGPQPRAGPTSRVWSRPHPRGTPPARCGWEHLPAPGPSSSRAAVPQGFLEALQAVEGQRAVLAGLQEALHVGQEDAAGREEARAQPEQLPAPLLAVPAGRRAGSGGGTRASTGLPRPTWLTARPRQRSSGCGGPAHAGPHRYARPGSEVLEPD